jgi:hypothetical protein
MSLRAITILPMLVAAPVFGQSAASSAQGDVSVTIYNNNLALVQDVRQIALPAGKRTIEFPDVSAQIRAETVTLGGTDVGIIEQNFDYDLLSPNALLKKAVGQMVTITAINPATGGKTNERAKILAVNGGVVLQIGNRIETMSEYGTTNIVYDSIPPNLRARPTLSVTLDSSRSGTRPLALSYLTPGMGWSADYVALFDERAGKIDVQGWITLNNSTGTTFTNARTLLVAGEVGQVQQGPRSYQRGMPNPRGNNPGIETGSRERVGDFYVYPIDGRTTIANAQTKQVSFLDASGVPARKGYEFRNSWLGASDEAQSAASVLKFSNAKAGGIGDALPAGTVRVYVRDARGQSQFIGESAIPHTPGGSALALKTGDAFDVKVQPVLVKREPITVDQWERYAQYRIVRKNGAVESVETVTVSTPKTFYLTQMRYIVTNAKPVPVRVDVVQGGLNQWWWWHDLRIPEESIKGEQVSADERVWDVAVAANGKTELTVTYVTPW